MFNNLGATSYLYGRSVELWQSKDNVYRITIIKILGAPVCLLEVVDIWLVGCFGLNGPLRQYFSLCRAVSQREGESKEK